VAPADAFVSVVMPVRNAAATLDDAIGSILRQTWPRLELLVVDDHSTDASAAVARAWAARDDRIRVIPSAGAGIVAALRTGFEAARGEFIARMDADDIAAPDRIAAQMALMLAEPACGVCATHVADCGDVGAGRRRYSAWLATVTSHDDVVRNLFVECPLAHPTLLLRRQALRAAGGYRDGPWPEDYDLIFRLWLAGWRFGVVARPLLQWRDHPGRLSRTDPRYAPEAFRACKLHYFMCSPYGFAGRPLVQWGAGREGKWWLRHWPAARVPQAVVDVDPRKIGQRIAGVPVIAPASLGAPQARFLVIAVGVHGARDLIRSYLAPLGWRELHDYIFVS
jgi:glycosyltransferase involved in cell wall biosynthesis